MKFLFRNKHLTVYIITPVCFLSSPCVIIFSPGTGATGLENGDKENSLRFSPLERGEWEERNTSEDRKPGYGVIIQQGLSRGSEG